ncbi:MAG: hypothetical protein R3F61_15315 [Myxococcota bacterium]
MHLMVALLAPAFASDDCVGGTCPKPHDEPVPAVREGRSSPPPIDQRAPEHLRTATFALG